MTDAALIVIRLGLAFTFFWTGYLILRNPHIWAQIIDKSWVKRIISVSSVRLMQTVAVFDIIVGIWIASGVFITIGLFLASLHLIQVLAVTGIMGPTYRDVGLLAAAIGLLMAYTSI